MFCFNRWYCAIGKYAAYFLITISAAFFTTQHQAAASDQVIDIGEVVISPKRDNPYGSRRYFNEIDSEGISCLRADSIEDVLDTFGSVEIKRRSVYGGQADLSLRGSSFEQVGVLINGIMVNDVQTGHYTMDLPVPLESIEKIEVLSPCESSFYGGNALAGSINIITKVPSERKVIIDASLGEHQLKRNLLSIACPINSIKNRVTFEHKESSGYRPDTDFRITTLAFQSAGDYFDFFGGYTRNDLGAGNSYSNLFPREEDHTKTTFLSLKLKKEFGDIEFKPVIHYRRHWNKFILDRNRPEWYVNYHTDYDYSLDLPFSFKIGESRLINGVKIGQSKITSTRLGNHAMAKGALYGNLRSKITQATNLDVSLRGDFFEKWPEQVSPALGINHEVNEQWSLNSSIARSFRIPSFTDLYYVSPANLGNEDLTPETAMTYEAGIDFKEGQHVVGLSLFFRDTDDIIDWTRNNASEAWQVQNISRAETVGCEANWDFDVNFKSDFISLKRASFGCAYLDTDYSQDDSLEIKYTADYLKHKMIFEAFLEYPFMLKQSLKIGYNNRAIGKDYFLLDTKISKTIEKEKYSTEIYLSATNLFNTSYSEVGDVTMPGRWVESGVKVIF